MGCQDFNRCHKECKNKNTESCILDSSCSDCYYFKFDELICPNCSRKIPNKEHLIKKGCKWCINEKM